MVRLFPVSTVFFLQPVVLLKFLFNAGPCCLGCMILLPLFSMSFDTQRFFILICPWSYFLSQCLLIAVVILIFTAQLGSLGDLFSFLSLDRMVCIWLKLSMFLLIRLIYGILDKYLSVILCQLHFLSSLVPCRIRLLCLLTLRLSLYYLWLGLLSR
jgi:hypothetical protein